jgi:hypothetical protein
MSHTTILGIWPGEKYKTIMELGNASGSAPVVWGALAKEFLDMPNAYYPGQGWMEHIDKVCELAHDPNVPLSLRAVLMMTFDTVYVTDYARAAKDIRFFMERYPNLDCSEEHPYVHGSRAFHWNTLAWFYDGKLNNKPSSPAVGVWHTSVSNNPFGSTWKEVEEDGEVIADVPFNWSTAYDLYAELDSHTK